MKVMCNITKSFVIKSLFLLLISMVACKPDPFIDGEGKTAIKMKSGNDIMEREKFDLTGEHIISIEEIDENSFYYKASRASKSIGKVSDFKHQWLQEGYTTQIKTVKSKNERLNKSLLSCWSNFNKDEWYIKVYNGQGKLETEKVIASPFPKAIIYGIHQIEISPNIILSEYAKKGVDISGYNTDFEAFAIIGADGLSNSNFIHFIAISYEPTIEIISFPSFVKADKKRLNHYKLEHFGSRIPPVIPPLSGESCNDLSRFLSGSSRFIAIGRGFSVPGIVQLSIYLDSDILIDTSNCSIEKAFFTYHIKTISDWTTYLSDKDAAFNNNWGKQVLIDTSDNKCNIYVAGNFSYPENAWMASLTCDGKINWVKEYYGLEGSIEFDAMLLDQDEIIVCGSTGYDFFKNQLYGYVGRIDKYSGEVIAQRYFGKPKKYRSLYTLLQKDDYIYVWGEDEYDYGWSFKIKKSNL